MISYAGNRFSGTSLESKPLNVPDGAIYNETDTLYQYIKVNNQWKLQIGYSGYSGYSGMIGIGLSGYSGYSGIGNVITVNQSNHNFNVLDVVRATSTENIFTLAKADTSDNADMVGVVCEILNANYFNLMFNGEITSTSVPNYPTGTYVFLSSTTAGGLTNIEPSGEYEISMPVGVIMVPQSKILILHLRGVEIIHNLGTSGYSGYSGIDGSSELFEVDGGWAGSLYAIPQVIDGGNI